MKKEKNVNYYRNLLHKDSIALLVIAIIFTIANVLFMGEGYDEAVPIFLKSIIFAIFSIILICNKKEMKKFIGNLTIIMSCLMILTSIGDGSLFGVVYFLLGIFLLIHSISYLKKFKNYNVELNDLNNTITKKSKIKYISLIPTILTIILVILAIVFNQSLIGISWYSITILVANVVGIILCMILHHKKVKSALIYVILVISIIITLFSGLYLIDEIGHNIRKSNYYNSEEFLIDYSKFAEEDIEEDIMLAGNLKKLNIDISQDNIVTLKKFLDVISTNEILSNDLYSINKLEENGYTCDGYTILKFKDTANIDDYYLMLNEEYNDTYNMKRFFKVKTYISCSGKYSYATDGFNRNLINNKEEIFTITIPESYFTFTNTQIDENIDSLKKLGNEYITNVKKENNTIILQMTESQKNNLIERNNKYIETLLNNFSNANEKYHYEFNSDFSELTYYFDENLSDTMQIKTVFGVAASYALNNILKTNNQNWSIHIKIINCHTNKTVAEGTIPEDTIKYGKQEWENSY